MYRHDREHVCFSGSMRMMLAIAELARRAEMNEQRADGTPGSRCHQAQ